MICEKRRAAGLRVAAVALCTQLSWAQTASAQYHLLHTFAGPSVGHPGSITQTADGDFLVTTVSRSDLGAVIRVSPSGSVTTLHVFTGPYQYPTGRLVLGNDGNYYGTTERTVYRIGPDGSFVTVHQFDASDGSGFSRGRLIKSADGRILGALADLGVSTTYFAIEADGTFQGSLFTIIEGTPIFTVDSDGAVYGIANCCFPSRTWQLYRRSNDGNVTILHEFSDVAVTAAAEFDIGLAPDGTLYGFSPASSLSDGSDDSCSIYRFGPGGFRTLRTLQGRCPYSDEQPSLFEGSDGSFYGRGPGFFPDVFRLSRTGAYQALHHFSTDDGSVSDLLQSADGTFWGTTGQGGTFGGGSLFSLTSSGVFNPVHAFPAGNVDGSMPRFPLVSIGSDLYGTTNSGGPFDMGTIFRMSRSGAFTSLYSFSGRSDGANPDGLVVGQDGMLYGTTPRTYGLNSQVIPRHVLQGHALWCPDDVVRLPGWRWWTWSVDACRRRILLRLDDHLRRLRRYHGVGIDFPDVDPGCRDDHQDIQCR
jgi:uncharacterized repeat protein (TIGR03803 family)